MALTSGSLYVQPYGIDGTTVQAKAAATGTYYPGDGVAYIAADGPYVQHAPAACAAGDQFEGFVMKEQTITTNGALLEYEQGQFVVPYAPAMTLKGLAYYETTENVATGSAGTLLPFGRFNGDANDVEASTAGVFYDVGLIPSGTTA